MFGKVDDPPEVVYRVVPVEPTSDLDDEDDFDDEDDDFDDEEFDEDDDDLDDEDDFDEDDDDFDDEDDDDLDDEDDFDEDDDDFEDEDDFDDDEEDDYGDCNLCGQVLMDNGNCPNDDCFYHDNTQDVDPPLTEHPAIQREVQKIVEKGVFKQQSQYVLVQDEDNVVTAVGPFTDPAPARAFAAGANYAFKLVDAENRVLGVVGSIVGFDNVEVQAPDLGKEFA